MCHSTLNTELTPSTLYKSHLIDIFAILRNTIHGWYHLPVKIGLCFYYKHSFRSNRVVFQNLYHRPHFHLCHIGKNHQYMCPSYWHMFYHYKSLKYKMRYCIPINLLQIPRKNYKIPVKPCYNLLKTYKTYKNL